MSKTPLKTVQVVYQPSSSEVIEVHSVEPVTYEPYKSIYGHQMEKLASWQQHRIDAGWVRVKGLRVSGRTTSRLLGHSSTKEMAVEMVEVDMPAADYEKGSNINVCM